MVADKFNVDLNKPLVFQVGHLGEGYQEWVHQPIVSKEGPRLFENNIMEFLTRTKWWVIPLVWLPVVSWSLVMAIRMGISLTQASLLVMVGMLIWTLLEYSLHRFIFHMNTKNYWSNTLHYLLHGCHHKHPMDSLRLVFPPAAAAILCIPVKSIALTNKKQKDNKSIANLNVKLRALARPNDFSSTTQFWGLIRVLSTPVATPAIFAGGLLGYVIYDCTHYYLHHGSPSNQPARYLKRYHVSHHFRIQNKGFGITSSLWDFAFGTLPPAFKIQKSS